MSRILRTGSSNASPIRVKSCRGAVEKVPVFVGMSWPASLSSQLISGMAAGVVKMGNLENFVRPSHLNS